jgi:hypothetical protein
MKQKALGKTRSLIKKVSTKNKSEMSTENFLTLFFMFRIKSIFHGSLQKSSPPRHFPPAIQATLKSPSKYLCTCMELLNLLNSGITGGCVDMLNSHLPPP